MNAICLTAFNRPQLLKTLLNSLKAQFNLWKWELYVQIEPSDKLHEVVHLITNINLGVKVHYRVNRKVLGVRDNPYQCIEWAIKEGALHFLLLEEDLELSADALQFCEHAFNTSDFSNK